MNGDDLKVRHVDWYFDEWLAGTARLDALEKGVYVTICNEIYSHGGPIEIDGLPKLCGCHGHAFKRAINRLQTLGKIFLNDSQIMVKRCAKELKKAQIRLSNIRENGGKGGRPPNKIKELAEPAGSLENNPMRASPNLQPTNHQPFKSPNGLFDRNAFDQWWQGYPHKVGKGKVQTAFAKALKKTSLDELIAGVERYKATKPLDQKWCNPATWLNEERWTDVPATNGHANGGDDLPFGGPPTGPPPIPEGGFFPVEGANAK